MLVRQLLGWTAVVVVAAILFVNALFMLISPRAWFRLPRWFPTRNSAMTEEKYGSGPDAIATRLTGAVMLAFILYIFYDAFLRRR
jgi:amino acid permease